MNISSLSLTVSMSQGASGTGGVQGHRGHHHHGGGGQQDMQTIADTLGISTDQLKQEMSSGSTLAQIAQNHGKTADDLVSALQTKDKSRLDQAVSDGKISSDQETQFLSQLKQRETNFVQNGTPQGRGGDRDGDSDGDGGGKVGGVGGLNDVASLLGAAGFGSSTGSTTSIGQALRAYGVDTGGLTQSLLDGVKSGLDQAVTGGKLSQSDESDLLSQISGSLNQAFGNDGINLAA